jgi:hypothetical protein
MLRVAGIRSFPDGRHGSSTTFAGVVGAATSTYRDPPWDL